MLKQPQVHTLTIEKLITWLQQQNPDQTYTWQDPVKCLVGHYLADHNSHWGEVSYSNLPHYHLIAETQPHTFGAALARAQELHSKTLALPTPTQTPIQIPLAIENHHPTS